MRSDFHPKEEAFIWRVWG